MSAWIENVYYLGQERGSECSVRLVAELIETFCLLCSCFVTDSDIPENPEKDLKCVRVGKG